MQLPLKFKFLLISEKKFFTCHAGSSKTAASIWIFDCPFFNRKTHGSCLLTV